MRGGAFPPIIPAESTASVQVMTSAACGCSPSGGVTADGGEFPRVRRRSSFGCFSGRQHPPDRGAREMVASAERRFMVGLEWADEKCRSSPDLKNEGFAGSARCFLHARCQYRAVLRRMPSRGPLLAGTDPPEGGYRLARPTVASALVFRGGYVASVPRARPQDWMKKHLY